MRRIEIPIDLILQLHGSIIYPCANKFDLASVDLAIMSCRSLERAYRLLGLLVE